jgi:hypothetical protein
MSTSLLLSLWRSEIEIELSEAKKTLAPLEHAHAAAVDAATEAVASYVNAQKLLDGAFSRLTSPVSQRLAHLRMRADEARSSSARAKGAVDLARAQVSELGSALRQLDHVIPADEAEAAA